MGLVTRMYNRYGERVREGIGWIGDLESGNGSPGSLQGPEDGSGNTEPDYHPGIGNAPAEGTSATTDVAVTADAFAWLDGEPLEGIEEEPSEDITTELAKVNPYRYAGYYWDRKTQMYFLQARYYDPRQARFISKDSYEGEISNPLSLNMFAYVQNSPLVYTDPSGHYCVSIDGDYAHDGLCKNPRNSIYLGEDTVYAGKSYIDRGTALGHLNSRGKIEWESTHNTKENYWGKNGLVGGFRGTWYSNQLTVVQVLELLKSDIKKNGELWTLYANSVYIQAIEAASFVAVDGIYDSGEVIRGIENVQAKYNIYNREDKKGVVDEVTINALIKNYKSTPDWLHNFNKIGYDLNLGEQFYAAMVWSIAGYRSSGATVSMGTGEFPTVWRGTKVVNGKTVVTDIGAFGEHIAEDLLAKNGWRNFTYIKNSSDNGIDIIARGPSGQLGFFEVKTSSTGNIPNLSARQTNMNAFVEDVLSNAANGTGVYKNIDSTTRKAAQKIYNEYLSNPNNVSGNVIGIDLKSGTIKISRWER